MSHRGAVLVRKSFFRGNRYNRKVKRAGYGIIELLGAGFVLCLNIFLGLFFIAVMSLALIYGYRVITECEYFALKTIEIHHSSGYHHLTYGDIVSECGLSVGDNIFKINIDKLYWRLSRNPWIKSIYIRRELPDTIKIDLTERRAYFWIQEKNYLFYADKMGKRMTKVLPERFISLPLLYIDTQYPYDVQVKQLLPAIVSLLDEKRFPFSWHDLSGIHLSLNRIEFFLENPQIRVNMEINDEISENAYKLYLVWSDLRHRGNELNDVDEIRVLSGQVLVKLKNKKSEK